MMMVNQLFSADLLIQFAIHVTSEEPTSISREKLRSVRARKLISAETEVNEFARITVGVFFVKSSGHPKQAILFIR